MSGWARRPQVVAGALAAVGWGVFATGAAAQRDGADVDVRATAIARARPATGLLVLQAEGRTESVHAEALVWSGARDASGGAQGSGDGMESTGDVLVAVVHARNLAGRADVRAGRMILVAGGLRPMHVDGADVRLRAPGELTVQGFAGIPVDPGDEQGRGFDWLAGGRIGRALGEWGSAGIAYVHRRDRGTLADEEIAADGLVTLGPLELSGKIAIDLVDLGPSEATVSSLLAVGDWRIEAFATERSPSRILPATSLFSVLGDVPSLHAGGALQWRAAPRLDLSTTIAARWVGSEAGEALLARARLRLDRDGRGALLLEARRDRGPDTAWTGVRTGVTVPWGARWRTAAELELVAADDPGERGALWPWMLFAIGWAPAPRWDVAGAVRASTTPELAQSFDALLRVTWTPEASR